MEKVSTHVGLDVHKASISVAMLVGGSSKAVEWKLANESQQVRRLVRKLRREGGGEVLCCYEAGPCGYELQRQFERAGVGCQVVAPSLIPRKPGDRVKTDRRDARKLAELLRAGVLTEVRPPSAEEEALRDLCRCREDARVDLLRARHRLSKLLLRRGLRYGGGRPWTQQHRAWLWSLVFEHAADQAVLEDYLLAVDQLSTRLKSLEAKIEEVAGAEPYGETVGWLRCFRGIDTITALSIVAELYGVERFARARSLMAYLGLVPSERSSGERSSRGGITKTGNRHLRRLLVEAAHHYRHRPAVGLTLRRRRAGQPAAVIAMADRAQQRLHRRYSRLLLGRGLPVQKVVVACARELTGFLWAVLHRDLQTTPGAAAAAGRSEETSQTPARAQSRARRGLRAAREKGN